MEGDGGTHGSLEWWLPSLYGSHVMYDRSPEGSENSVLHVMELGTMRVQPERIAGAQDTNSSWLPDGSGSFYGRVADTSKMGPVDYKKSPALLYGLGIEAKGNLLLLAAHGCDPAVVLSNSDFPSIFCSAGSDWALSSIWFGTFFLVRC